MKCLSFVVALWNLPATMLISDCLLLLTKQGKKVFKSYCLPMLTFVFVFTRKSGNRAKWSPEAEGGGEATVLSCQLPPLRVEGSKKFQSHQKLGENNGWENGVCEETCNFEKMWNCQGKGTLQVWYGTKIHSRERQKVMKREDGRYHTILYGGTASIHIMHFGNGWNWGVDS